MLKKIIIIAGLSFVLCHITYGLEQLKQTKEDIKNAKDQLAQTRKDLKGSYRDQEKLLDQIGDVLPMITQYKDMTETFYPVAETLRAVLIANVVNPLTAYIAVPVLVIAGDIPDIMRTLKNLLGSIHSTLTTIDNTIKPKAMYLSSVDPKGLYKQLDVAQQAFGDVENKLDQIIAGLQRVAAGIRGKPAQQIIIEEEE